MTARNETDAQSLSRLTGAEKEVLRAEPFPVPAPTMILRVLAVLLAITGCSCSSPPTSCAEMTMKACTESPGCILDKGPSGPPICRVATTCEQRLTNRAAAPTSDFAKHCEADATCRYEDRGCFCPCGLSGFPACACACGGGLPPRCAERR